MPNVESMDDWAIFYLQTPNGLIKNVMYGGGWHSQGFGSMFQHDASTAVVISGSTDDDAVQVLGFAEGETNVIRFQNAGELVVVEDGNYKIDWYCSFHAVSGSGQNVEGLIGLNGKFQTIGTAHRKLGTGTDTGNMAGTAILALKANDIVSLMLINETSTVDLEVDHAGLTIIQLGV